MTKPKKTPYQIQWYENVGKEVKKLGLSGAARAQIEVQVGNLQWWEEREAREVTGIKQLHGRYREIFELRLKGGALGRTNLRVFFAVFNSQRQVVILGVTKKESERALNHVYETMLDRLERVEQELRMSRLRKDREGRL